MQPNRTWLRSPATVIALISLTMCVSTARARQYIPEPRRRTPIPPTTQRARPPQATIDFWAVPNQEIPDKVHLGNFQSKLANTVVSYVYYLPPDYESNPARRYPVIYELPGLGGDCRETCRMLMKFDEGIDLKVCPPVIVIGVQGVLGSFYTDSKNGKRPIESVIMKELIPHIDATFRTIPRANARALEGFSMGGYGAAHLIFKYPETFGVASILSAPTGTLKSFQDEMPEFATDVWGDDQDYFDENDPYLLVKRNVEKLRGKVKLRIICGADDRYRVFADDLHDLLVYKDIDHDFKIVPGARRNLGQLLLPIARDVFPFWKDTLSINEMGNQTGNPSGQK